MKYTDGHYFESSPVSYCAAFSDARHISPASPPTRMMHPSPFYKYKYRFKYSDLYLECHLTFFLICKSKDSLYIQIPLLQIEMHINLLVLKINA